MFSPKFLMLDAVRYRPDGVAARGLVNGRDPRHRRGRDLPYRTVIRNDRCKDTQKWLSDRFLAYARDDRELKILAFEDGSGGDGSAVLLTVLDVESVAQGQDDVRIDRSDLGKRKESGGFPAVLVSGRMKGIMED